MPPTKKICPECGEEKFAMHMPMHLFKEHGIGDPPASFGKRTVKDDAGDPVVAPTEVIEPRHAAATDVDLPDEPAPVTDGAEIQQAL